MSLPPPVPNESMHHLLRSRPMSIRSRLHANMNKHMSMLGGLDPGFFFRASATSPTYIANSGKGVLMVLHAPCIISYINTLSISDACTRSIAAKTPRKQCHGYARREKDDKTSWRFLARLCGKSLLSPAQSFSESTTLTSS